MFDFEIFEIVKKHIDELDYCGLLDMGAPSNEFDFESRMICERLSQNTTASELAILIAEVFNSQFSTENTPDYFLPTAIKILEELTF